MRPGRVRQSKTCIRTGSRKKWTQAKIRILKRKQQQKKTQETEHYLFSIIVSTNMGRKFLNLLDKHTPSHHKLHLICNRNCMKVSYSCMPNMASIIKSQNFNEPNPSKTDKTKPAKTCNCRNKSNCPLNQARRQRGGSPRFSSLPPPRFISSPPRYFLGRKKLLVLAGKSLRISAKTFFLDHLFLAGKNV